MERVKIVSGDNGVYFDARGRRLCTMGDYTPRVGEWVYTNGKTIYGHMTGGEIPAVINPASEMLPWVNAMYTMVDANYSDVNSFRTIKEGIYGYAGNDHIAYIVSKLDNSKAKVHCLNTGKDIGAYNILDAVIDDNDNIIIAEQGYSRYTNYSSNWGIQWHTTPIPVATTMESSGGSGAQQESKWNINWLVCIATPWEHKSDEQEDYTMKIRENSDIIAQFNLRGPLESAKNIALNEAFKVHYGCGDSSGKEFEKYTFYTGEYVSYDAGKPGWRYRHLDNIKNVYQGRREQPYPYCDGAGASFDWVKVHKDGTYYGVFTVYASAYGFPWFSRDVSMQRTEIDKKGVAHTVTKTEKYRDWLTVSTNYVTRYFVKNGSATQIEERLSVSMESGAFTGEMGDGAFQTPFKSLSLYDMQGAKVCRYKGAQAYYIFGYNNYNIVSSLGTERIWDVYSCGTRLYQDFDYNKPERDTKMVADALYEYGVDQQTIYDRSNTPPIDTFILNGRYTGKVTYDKSSVTRVDLYDNGTKITTVTNNQVDTSSWYKWRMAKVKDAYFVFPTSGGSFFIKDGNITANRDSGRCYAFLTFTADFFKSRARLLQLLKGE